jgi:hypothetical protein
MDDSESWFHVLPNWLDPAIPIRSFAGGVGGPVRIGPLDPMRPGDAMKSLLG